MPKPTNRTALAALLPLLLVASLGCDRLQDELIDKAPPGEQAAPHAPVKEKAASKAKSAEPDTAANTEPTTASDDGAGEPETSKPSTKAEADDDGDEPSVDLDADLYVKRLVLARGIEGREPLQPSSVFFTGQQSRIYAFIEVGNRDRRASEVRVSFVREGDAEQGVVTLKVGASPRWRTWAFTRKARKPGRYTVIVRDGRGEELARKPFTLQGEDAPAAPANKSAGPSA
jgi:hypothetical protein